MGIRRFVSWIKKMLFETVLLECILVTLMLSLSPSKSSADTIDHYVNIVNNIPKMEMKADPQAQAWARSARHVLTITEESIAETLLQANEAANAQGKPLFCLPSGQALTATNLNSIIMQTYQGISSQQSDKNQMTISQIAWMGVMQKYPCGGANLAQNMAFLQNGPAHTQAPSPLSSLGAPPATQKVVTAK